MIQGCLSTTDLLQGSTLPHMEGGLEAPGLITILPEEQY